MLVFLSLRLIPGGYADILLGPFVTPDARAAIAARYGLDQPIVVQYRPLAAGAAPGRFRRVDGDAQAGDRRVPPPRAGHAGAGADRAGLALCRAAFRWALRRASARAGGAASSAALVGALGASVPDFVLGSVLIFVFSVWSLWFRVGGYVPFGEDPVGNLRDHAAARPDALGLRYRPGPAHDAGCGAAGDDRRLHHRRRRARRASARHRAAARAAQRGDPGGDGGHHLFRLPAGRRGGGRGAVFDPGLRPLHLQRAAEPGLRHRAGRRADRRGSSFIAINMLADVLYAAIDPRVGTGEGR